MFWRKRFAKILQIIIYELQFWKKCHFDKLSFGQKVTDLFFSPSASLLDVARRSGKFKYWFFWLSMTQKKTQLSLFSLFPKLSPELRPRKRRKKVKWKMSKWMISVFAFLQHTKKQICIFFHFFCKFPNFRGKMKTSDGFQRNSSTSPGCKNYSPIAKNNSAIGSWYLYILAGLTKVGRIFYGHDNGSLSSC